MGVLRCLPLSVRLRSVLSGTLACVLAWLMFAASEVKAEQPEPSIGIERRVPWTTSRVTGSPDPPAPFRLELAFPNLRFQNPVTLTSAPNLDRLFVVELEGRISSFANDPNCRETDLAIDLKQTSQAAERTYGLTFHPDFPRTPHCFICYIVAAEQEDGTRVSRFTVQLDGAPRILADSEEILLTWQSGGHNGGCLKFGPDGYLYISTGDGGPAFPPDPLMSGQDVSNLLASILRIDVDHQEEGGPYAIPSSNPFVDLPGARGEVWAFGLRNPWRMSFDSLTGDLWVGDVGWELWELVYRVERGANYGWSIVEGSQPVHRERPRGPTPIVAPVVEHSHIEARSITGGYVYRGQRLDELYGAYVYGDYVTGKLWALRYDGQQVRELTELADTDLQIICFGEDNRGELFVVGYDGTIHHLLRNESATANSDFPQLLSETGLFESPADHRVAPGVLSYSINAEPWMDGSVAERYLALPGSEKLGIQEEQNPQKGLLKGNWSWPRDSVLLKTISLPLDPARPHKTRRLETQLLHYDGETWRAYSYHWNAEQTDARLAPDESAELTVEVADPHWPGGRRQQTWHFASRTQCLLCHSTRGGSVYGFNPPQLTRAHDYGDYHQGGRVGDQLATLRHLGYFEVVAENEIETMVDPYDEAASLEPRARAYLHVNCAHCHRRGGGGTAAIELEYQLPLDKTHLLDARPTQGTFGIHAAQVLAAGDPHRSVLYYRVAKLGRGRMPYIGSSLVDDRGLRLLRDWIAGLPGAEAAQQSHSATRRAQQEALQTLTDGSRSGPEVESAIQQLLATTSGGLLLSDALTEETLPRGIAQRAIEAAMALGDVQVRDLFERFVPEHSRTRRLGQSFDPAEILALSGDPGRGRELFERAEGVQCRNCHRFGDVGRPLGPDLKEIAAKQTAPQLLESIIRPSQNITPQYVTQLVETIDGQVYVGLLIQRDDREVVLKDAQSKEIRVPIDAVELIVPQQKSLMPELLFQDMTAQEVADLLAYFKSGQN